MSVFIGTFYFRRWAFNLRSVYAFYEFDPDAGVVRYRRSETDPWQEHATTAAEVKAARSYFRERLPNSASQ
jgi:hypothetical protein